MTIRRVLVALPVVSLLLTGLMAPGLTQSDGAAESEKLDKKLEQAEGEVEEAIQVFEKIMSDPDKRIPAELLAESEGIAIIPDVYQAGFIFGGRRGTGVMMVRYPDGTWSNPTFVSLTGGSFGLQIGAKSSDIVLVFPSRETVNEVLSRDYRLGGSISGTAGPASTRGDSVERYSKDKIYTYSRSQGLFGGLTLNGSKLGLKKDRVQYFYGDDAITTRKIFTDPFIPAPVVVNSLRDVLEQSELGTFRRF
ncbi:MAG: lipid-binding SYLF domain-containing protein [Cyanobacteria bacterium P01_A01_bin.17]